MFMIVELTPNGPTDVNDTDGELVVFETGRDAAAYCQTKAIETGKKYQPRPIAGDDDWRERETRRFCNEYQNLPMAFTDTLFDAMHRNRVEYPNIDYDKRTNDHFAHVAKEDPSMIAFTENEAKGKLDKQLRIKPGRYLERFFGDVLNPAQIAEAAAKYSASTDTGTLLFAKTEAAIVSVYINGPESCMSGNADDYSSPVHPVSVYAAGDLAIAYVRREDRITARVLVWPEKKRYGRIYGDSYRIAPLLKEAGYVSGYFAGARLKRIEHRSYFVCPYLDNHSTVEDDGEHLIIGYGNIDANQTNGLTGEDESGAVCDHCGDSYDENEGAYIENREETWCDRCAENHAVHCEHCEMTVASDANSVNVSGRAYAETWCDACVEADASPCEATDELWHNDDVVTLEDGTIWSAQHFAEHGFQCDTCGACLENGETCGDDCAQNDKPDDDTEATPVAACA